MNSNHPVAYSPRRKRFLPGRMGSRISWTSQARSDSSVNTSTRRSALGVSLVSLGIDENHLRHEVGRAWTGSRRRPMQRMCSCARAHTETVIRITARGLASPVHVFDRQTDQCCRRSHTRYAVTAETCSSVISLLEKRGIAPTPLRIWIFIANRGNGLLFSAGPSPLSPPG